MPTISMEQPCKLQIDCESCGKEYTSDSTILVYCTAPDEPSACKGAVEGLQKMMDSGTLSCSLFTEVKPCSSCGHSQSWVVQGKRNRIGRYGRALALKVPAILFFVSIVIAILSDSVAKKRSVIESLFAVLRAEINPLKYPLAVIFLVLVLIAIVAGIVVILSARQHDPNREWREKQGLSKSDASKPREAIKGVEITGDAEFRRGGLSQFLTG